MNAITSPPLETTACAPTGDAAFEHWLHACSHNPWAPLTAPAAKPYGFIWQAWLRFLAGMPTTAAADGWAHATPEQVLAFVNHGPQSPKHPQPSDITRRRYWRVLDRVYDHALVQAWVQRNPAQAITAQDKPPSEDPQGAILSPRMWRALTQHLPVPQDLISARDRAVLELLMELGLTPEEVRHLEVEHLLWEGAPTPAAQPPAAPSATITAIHIVGERDRQTRVLPVSARLGQSLQQWLAARAGYHAMQGQPALFCTRKAPQLSNHTLLHLVTKTLKAAAAATGQPEPPRLGPQVLRNTVLVQWLESGVPVDEVLARAGMKHPNALLHLRAYLSPA